MKRREFIAGLGGAVGWPVAQPFAAEAQRRVGALLPNAGDNDPTFQPILRAFREGLATFGWVKSRMISSEDQRLFRQMFHPSCIGHAIDFPFVGMISDEDMQPHRRQARQITANPCRSS